MTDQDSAAISTAAKLLGKFGIEAGFIVPTATGLSKAIMDATWPLREHLARKGFHDYQLQGQGPDCKRVVDGMFVRPDGTVRVRVSLYRPVTKDGDPRIWISNLCSFAAPGDVLALIVDCQNLFILNCSQGNPETQLADKSSPLGKLVSRLDIYAAPAAELLSKLKVLGAKGFVPSERGGDTGIGYTLESHLGIAANSSKSPDFKGIEIKSGRLLRGGNGGRHITLFSQIPKRNISPFSARQALETFGYRDPQTNRLQLFCSIDARVANSLGFQLDHLPDTNNLAACNSKTLPKNSPVFLWLLSELRTSFAAKHRESFWVAAEVLKVNGIEHFHFVRARHTRTPPLSTFDRLLASGGICLDLTMSEKGVAAVRDHGYLFRVYASSFDELFPEVGVYQLA